MLRAQGPGAVLPVKGGEAEPGIQACLQAKEHCQEMFSKTGNWKNRGAKTLSV